MLVGPFAVAALVVVAAGLAKLRSPATAARALTVIFFRGYGAENASRGLVRTLAGVEVSVGIACLAGPSAVTAGALAVLYAAFCATGVVLARQTAACGCFGGLEDAAPTTAAQPLLSGLLALLATAAAFAPPHGIAWVLNRPWADAATLVLGIAGATFGAILAYTELPRAWAAWSGR